MAATQYFATFFFFESWGAEPNDLVNFFNKTVYCSTVCGPSKFFRWSRSKEENWKIKNWKKSLSNKLF